MKIRAYNTSRDKEFNRTENSIVFTDIETLLRHLGQNDYWYHGKEGSKQVTADQDFHNCYREAFEGMGIPKYWVVEEMPTNTKTRIVGVSCLYALPQRLDKYVFKDVDDLLSTGISVAHTSLYPMTLEEFIKRFAGLPAYEPSYGHRPKTCDELNWKEYDFVALETID